MHVRRRIRRIGTSDIWKDESKKEPEKKDPKKRRKRKKDMLPEGCAREKKTGCGLQGTH